MGNGGSVSRVLDSVAGVCVTCAHALPNPFTAGLAVLTSVASGVARIVDGANRSNPTIDAIAELNLLRQRQAALEDDLKNAKGQAEEEKRKAQEELEEVQRQLREGIRPVIVPTTDDVARIKQKLQYREGYYHFAIAGVSGSGKSSLINALRGLRNKDPGAAKAGVTETTQQIGRYEHQDGKKIILYDVPGAGTLNVSDWQYFHEQGLYVFDAIIVLIDNRFTMTDVAIIMNCERFQIPCYLVRSKCDIHIRNVVMEMTEMNDDDSRAEAEIEKEATEHVVEETRKDVRRNLERANLRDQRVYLISNRTMLGSVRTSTGGSVPDKIIDELQLLNDILSDALARRGSDEQESTDS